MPRKTSQGKPTVAEQLRLEQARVEAYRLALTQDADVLAMTRRLIDQALELIEAGRVDLAATNLRLAQGLLKPSKPRSGHVV
jgi:hypothetical protein